jgi:hypothetical protein
MMNEMQFGRRIRQILNQGTQVSPNIAERLTRSRELALARQRPEPAPALAWQTTPSFASAAGAG